jgi:hypothetical protein
MSNESTENQDAELEDNTISDCEEEASGKPQVLVLGLKLIAFFFVEIHFNTVDYYEKTSLMHFPPSIYIPDEIKLISGRFFTE